MVTGGASENTCQSVCFGASEYVAVTVRGTVAKYL